jgi:PAS domain S-box-containing protein
LRERWGPILDHLAEAVTIATGDGKIVYANQAVADMLGVDSPEVLTGAQPGAVVARYVSTDEHGEPVDPEAMPGRRVLRGEESAQLLTRTMHPRTNEERWFLTKARRLPDEGDLELAVNVVEDLTVVKRAERYQRILARAGETLGSSLDYARTLTEVTGIVVPDLADWCVIDLVDHHGRIEAVAMVHFDPEMEQRGQDVRRRYPLDPESQHAIPVVIRTGRSIVTPAPNDEQLRAVSQDQEHFERMRAVGLGALMIVPIEAHGERLGAMSLAAARDGRRFGDQDLELAQELGRRAGMAIANARAYAARADIAHTLQQSLRPSEPPAIAGVEIASAFEPVGEATEMGGDFYEVFEIGDDWMAVIGDVVGKGAAAAGVTALARHTIHAVGQLTGDPLAALGALDARLHDDGASALCSVLLIHGHGGSDVLEVVSAGHPLALLVRDGVVGPVGEPGPLPGAMPGLVWSATAVTLAPGDALVLYTDGVTEAVGAGNERFGDARLTAALAGGGSATELVDAVQDALRAFRVGPPRDDLAMLALRRV